jgi:hypothetical protein
MSKTILVLATVATLGFCSTAFADVARPAVKHQVRSAHIDAPVTPKRTVHWIGTKKYIVVHGHKVWLPRQARVTSKNHIASHVPGSKQKRTKVSS